MLPIHVHIALLQLFSLLVTVGSAQKWELNAPSQPPASASKPVDRQFLGLMVESTSWQDYSSQALSQNLIQNIVTKTGAPMIIRVGGTSGDQFVYNASQTQAVVRDNPADTSLTANVTVGQAWMKGFANIKNARYILQAPLARNQLNRTIDFVKAAVNVIGQANLEAVEIGNEPDLYAQQCKRCKGVQGAQPCKGCTGYSLSAWVQEFLRYADAISANVNLPPGPIYQAGAFAWHSDSSRFWRPQDAYSMGLGKNPRIKTFAMHYYQTTVGNSLRDRLLNHNYTVSRTSTLNSFLSYMHSNHASVPFVLGEAGDALGSLVDGEAQLDAVLGSALWEVDWLLYAMASSYNRVNMNQCKRCNFASWWTAQENNIPAVIRSQYFGLALVADFLGGNNLRANPKSSLRVSSLYQNDHPFLSAYAGYVDNKLDRYVVVELNQWNKTSATPRPTRDVTLSVPPNVTGAELRRLTGASTDASATDMSYAGLRYTVSNTGGEVVGPSVEKLKIQNGKLGFRLSASEAGLIFLRYT